MRLLKAHTTKKVLLIGIGILVVTLGLVLTYYLQHSDTNTATIKKGPVVRYSTDTPDETKPKPGYRWQGAPNEPKNITIPSAGIDNYIQNIGVDQRKELAVPNNIHVAGWFVDSVLPGEKGLSIIDGHLNGPNEDGVFINLEKVKMNDNITIKFGDDSIKIFEVTKVEIVSLDEAATALYSQDPKASSQLNLITCGGMYDSTSRLYDKRVIISSVLKKHL